MRIIFFLIIIAVICIGIGCKEQRKLSKAELLSYVSKKDNRLRKEVEIKNVRAELMYKPSSLLVLQELEAMGNLTKQSIDSLEKKYDDYFYFVLKLSKQNKELIRQLGDFSSYSSALQMLAFDMQSYVTLVAGLDTVPVTDYYFDQTYGMGSGNNILLSFSKSELKSNEILDIYLNECGFGMGNLKFSFDKADLEGVPQLDYSLNY